MGSGGLDQVWGEQRVGGLSLHIFSRSGIFYLRWEVTMLCVKATMKIH